MAVVAFACGAGFLAIAFTSGDVFPVAVAFLHGGFAIFCFIVSLACLSRRTHPFTLRIIGAVIFISYSLYVYHSLGGQDWPKAVAGFCILGLPSAYLMLKGRYPSWGKASAAFNPEVPSGHDDEQ